MPTYFAYCRKSTEAEDRQILSIDSQINELKRHAAKRGLNIAAVLTEAKSAKAPGRPVFNSMMQPLYRGEADGILCWKLDRLARNPVDGGSIIWAMKEHDVKIITPFQTYGQSEDNVVWMYLEFGMAQKYVDDLSKTVRRGLRAKAESGWFPCPTPPGYRNLENEEGRNVVGRDPKRFDLIRKCWDLMLTGNHTPTEIRRIANTAWEYKTMHGKFAYRMKEVCPGCRIPIAEMKNPLKLAYCYYHCTKSQNHTCTERGIKREELERQISGELEKIRLPVLHDLWLNRSFGRLSGNQKESDALGTIRKLFATSTLETQRQIVFTVFSSMTLKDQKLVVSPKPPFEFTGEEQMPRPLDEDTLALESLEEEIIPVTGRITFEGTIPKLGRIPSRQNFSKV